MRSLIPYAVLFFLIPCITFPQPYFAIGTLSPAIGWSTNNNTKHLSHMSWAASGKFGITNRAEIGFLYFIGHPLPLSVTQKAIEKYPPFQIKTITISQNAAMIHIELSVQKHVQITIELLTLFGKKVQHLHYRGYPAEIFKMYVPIPAVASGMYFLRIQSMEYTIIYPVQIVF